VTSWYLCPAPPTATPSAKTAQTAIKTAQKRIVRMVLNAQTIARKSSCNKHSRALRKNKQNSSCLLRLFA
jgi:hypothetical protein